ncbi:putative DNA-directed RNA polymerase III, 62-kS-subunit, partial [Operophtera brumata]
MSNQLGRVVSVILHRYFGEIVQKVEAELLIEELLQQATCTATVLLVTIANKYKDDKDTFISLVTAAYIQQAPVAELSEGGDLPTLVPVATIVPDLDTRALIQAAATGDTISYEAPVAELSEGGDLPTLVPVATIVPELDTRALIQAAATGDTSDLSEGSDLPTLVPVATIVPELDTRALIEAAATGDTSDINDKICWRVNNDRFHQDFRDDLMIKAVSRRIDDNAAPANDAADVHNVPGVGARVQSHARRGTAGSVPAPTGDAAGGQFVVRTKHAVEQLLHAVLEHAVTERLGSKAARIFRRRRHTEERYATEQTVQRVAHTVQEMCYRALHNVIRRGSHTHAAHARLLDKQRRVRSIVHGMRARAEPQQHITDVEETLTPPEQAALRGVERQLKQLSTAELELDRDLFILN